MGAKYTKMMLLFHHLVVTVAALAIPCVSGCFCGQDPLTIERTTAITQDFIRSSKYVLIAAMI